MLTSSLSGICRLSAIMLLIFLSVLVVGTPGVFAGEHNYGGGGGRGGGGRNIGPGIIGGIGAAIIINEALKERQRQRHYEERPARYRPEKVREPKPRGCPAGTVWSRRKRSCAPKYEPVKAPKCNFPYVSSGKGCVCASGYDSRRGRCVKEKPVEIVKPRKEREPEVVRAPKPEPKIVRAPKPEPKVVRSPKEEPKLSRAPKQAAKLAAISPLPGADRCLPQDLFDLLSQAYGAPAGVSACANTCLPKPVRFGEAEIQKAAADHGVDWCDSCIALGAWLPLKTIVTLEEETGQTFCAAPADLCVFPGVRAGAPRVEIQTLFKDMPASIGRDGAIAIVIGNERYDGQTPGNTNGHADADAVEKLLVDQLGFDKANIISVRDARLADLDTILGPADATGGDLAKRVGARADADILIYVSSHGLIDANGAAYLAPSDVETGRIAETAYPIARLYDNLAKAGARTIMLALEATFAANLNGFADPPNLPSLEVAIMPVSPVPGLAVFKASDRDQRTLEDPEFGIGLFTRHFIEGLAGKADAPPIGNSDRRIDTVELFVFTADVVRMAARKSFGLEQKPILGEGGNLVVGRLAAR